MFRCHGAKVHNFICEPAHSDLRNFLPVIAALVLHAKLHPMSAALLAVPDDEDGTEMLVLPIPRTPKAGLGCNCSNRRAARYMPEHLCGIRLHPICICGVPDLFTFC